MNEETRPHWRTGFIKMATLMGLEPTTSAVTGRRSKPTELQRQSGGRGWDRTNDFPRVKRTLSR